MLAAAENLISLFKQVSACPEIMEEAIQVGPDLVEPQALHARAMAVIERRDSRALGAWSGRYLQNLSAGLASADVREVAAGASHGRVDGLFVAVGVQCWGVFDSATGSATLHERREAGDEDLLNLSAVLTAVNGGTVFAVPPADVPGGSSLAAVFRY